MKEDVMAISQARKMLPELAKKAKKRMYRCVVTNKGAAEFVVLGIDDYRSLQATASLLKRPDIMNIIEASDKELESGQALTVEEARSFLGVAGEPEAAKKK